MKTVYTSLAHKIDEALLLRAFGQLRRDGAAGIDGVRWKEYKQNLEGNVHVLHEKLKTQKYQATPSRRVHIPKEDGSQRTISIGILEDRLVQKAVSLLIEPIFEEEFLDGSFGFRPGKSQHQALEVLRTHVMGNRLYWVIDLDLRKYFDSVPHGPLHDCLHHRVKDGGIDRLIGKWLKCGSLEGGEVISSTQGVPQGGTISPLLSNVYLHYVLDQWFEDEVKPCLRGTAAIVRFADDAFIGCEFESDARRVMEVLPKRLGRFGLALHPEKTKLVNFTKPQLQATKLDHEKRTFNFLGFTHYWGKTRKGFWIVKRRTMKQRLNRTKVRINEWCKENRHLPIKEQQRMLNAKLRGHYQYYGLSGNFRSLNNVYYNALHIWRKWLSRRSQRGRISWEHYLKLLIRYPLQKPRIYHGIYTGQLSFF